MPDLLSRFVENERELEAEFRTISRRLESYHDLFRALWEIGEPLFTRQIGTAAIVFSGSGKPLRFLFNPDFWRELPDHDREFVICHEMLHAVLNHGFRFVGLESKLLANVAADLAVNHLLVAQFGFIRELLQDWEQACWVETVFAGTGAKLPATNLTMEEYYRLCVANPNITLVEGPDEHQFESGGGLGSLLNARAAAEVDMVLSDMGAEITQDVAARLGEEARVITQRGTQARGAWCAVPPIKPPKVAWEKVIHRRLSSARQVGESAGWVHPARRFASFTELTLPGTIESRVRTHKGRQDCLFFLDASGSTWDMRDRFFALAQSLPSKHFRVELCSFDAEVYRLDIRRPEIIGGGGTSFSVLESWIQTQIQLGHLPKYPDVVIVLTDGLGDVVHPAFPERWHWLLTTSERNCIPRQCTVLRLSQYA